MNKRVRQTSQAEGNSDRLSQLPENLIEQILSRLPIREAVRTSVLSSEWRYKWNTLPVLNFDDRCMPPSFFSDDASTVHLKWEQMIYQILLFHTGSVRWLAITQKKIPPGKEIARCISYLPRIAVERLSLHFSAGTCKLPSTLFKCQSLTVLSLSNCLMKLPSRFEGFKNLKILVLYFVRVARDELETLISSCPLLERMVMICTSGVRDLKIEAPKLLQIDLGGCFLSLGFSANLLATVVVTLFMDIEGEQARAHQRHDKNFLNFFAGLPHLRSLSAKGYSLKYWSVGETPKKLPRPALLLQSLEVEIDFGSVKDISTALCLLRSFPNLKEV